MFFELKKWFKKTIRRAVADHAASTRPRPVPAVPWDSAVSLELETDDNRLLFVPLDSISHLSSDPFPTEKGEDFGKAEGEAEAKPRRAPRARVHMKNGDEHTLAFSYDTIREKYSTIRQTVLENIIKFYGDRPHVDRR